MVFEFISLVALAKGINRKREEDPGWNSQPLQIKRLETREASRGYGQAVDRKQKAGRDVKDRKDTEGVTGWLSPLSVQLLISA